MMMPTRHQFSAFAPENTPLLRENQYNYLRFNFLNPPVHYPRTHDSNIPEFQHSNCERSELTCDGAIPSGNSVAVFNLLRLGHMSAKADYLTKAERIIKSFSAEIALHPAGHCQLMVALEFALNPNYEVVIVGKPGRNDTAVMLAALRKPFLPEKVVLFRPMDALASKDITAIAPFTLPMAAKNGRATAYVCREFACKLPTTRIDQMLKNLRQN